MSGRVAVTIVTYNSARYIASCIEHTLAQDYAPLQMIVVDNASGDGTAEILRSFEDHDRIRVLYNSTNVGFAGGQNQAISAVPDADWVLTLNPDVRLATDFVRELVMTGEAHPEAGSLCGKLLAASRDFATPAQPLLDSTGIYVTPNLRHLDRGNGAADEGQYNTAEYVFGATGAACVYRRSMIRDISIFGEFFDTDFFAYREDADVAWRAQLLGWKCLYVPRAAALHVRTVVPGARAGLPAVINLHSVKNRWLLRIKNTTPALYKRLWLPISLRDVTVVGGCLLSEWSSLPAFPLVMKLWKRTWAKRREIMKRKRADDDYIAGWFSEQPVSYPVNMQR